MKPKLNKVRTDSKLALYLTNLINNHHKTQAEIAAEAGYANPNNITMIKQGLTKLAINKVPALAKALEINPAELMVMTLEEYTPEILEVMQESMALPRNEMEASLFAVIQKTLDTVNIKNRHAPNDKLNDAVSKAIISSC